MKQHALQTAITLYQGGTLDVETAAKKAGISPERLQRAVERAGGVLGTGPSASPERISLGAD
jgi:hypothetical protein